MKKFLKFACTIASLAVLLFFSNNVFAQGDDCGAAVDISFAFDNAFANPCNYQVEGPYTNTGATIDADAANFDETWEAVTGTMSCCACESENSGDPDVDNPVWFQFTPTNTGDYSIFALGDESSQHGCSAEFAVPGDDDTQFWILTGSCGNLSLYDCNEDATGALLFEAGGTFNFTAGTTYYLVVDGYLGSQGEFCLEIANDTGSCVNCGDGICGLGFGETYCGCSSECPCDLLDGRFLVNDGTGPGGWSSTILGTEEVAFCADYLTSLGIPGLNPANTFLGYAFVQTTDIDGDGYAGNCANTPITEVTVTYDIGTITDGVNTIPSGSTNVPVNFVLFFELTPAEVANNGGITVQICIPDDGLGNQCCVDKFITFDPNLTPGVTNPACPCAAGSVTDPAVVMQTACVGEGDTVEFCTDGNENLSLECPPGFTYQYAWQLIGDFYGNPPATILTPRIILSPCETVNVDDFFFDSVGVIPPYFYVDVPFPPGFTYLVQGSAVCVNDVDGTIDSGCNALGQIEIILQDTGTCEADVPGCMDPCDPAFTPDSTDDTLCVGYSTDCNADCTAGPFGGTWDQASCACINETAPVLGCTDPAACNFDAAANCDDGNCLAAPTCNTDPCAGDLEIIDPNDACSCIVDQPQVLGCTDPAACNFDMAANCDDGNCDLGNAACPDPCNEPDPDDNCPITTDTFDAATCTVTNTPNCAAGESFNPATCECVVDMVDGCTDPCDPAFDPLSTNDLLCVGYSTDCNADCTAGPFGGVWDAASCSCINETAPVSGCTDAAACNYDAAANCDDSNCDLGNTACPDPCNEPDPDDGCDLTTDTFDAATCTVTNTPNCAAGEVFNAASCECVIDMVDGCTDPCDPNYDPASTNDDLCAGYSTDCNADCNVGPFGGTWDAASCSCINEIAPALGCTDPTANNYDAGANCEDNSCMFDCPAQPATIAGGPFSFCVGDGTPDFVAGITVSGGTGANSAWVITDDQLNILGIPSMPGVVDFDGAGVGTCLIWYVTYDDIVGAEVGMNAGDLTGCFALSNSIEVLRNDDCDCEDEISGTIVTDDSCDVSGIAVLITDADGNPIGMAIADANGDYILSGGPYACGEYIATLDAGSIPTCYTDAGGDVGPAGFVVNGDGEADGANFSSFQEVPTLSQWGLMSLALLLMIFGALKLATINNVQLNRKKA